MSNYLFSILTEKVYNFFFLLVGCCNLHLPITTFVLRFPPFPHSSFSPSSPSLSLSVFGDRVSYPRLVLIQYLIETDCEFLSLYFLSPEIREDCVIKLGLFFGSVCSYLCAYTDVCSCGGQRSPWVSFLRCQPPWLF